MSPESNSVDFVYEYDLLGNLTRSRVLVGYLEDIDVHYTYDNQNRITRVQQTGPEITPKTITYDHLFAQYSSNDAPVLHTTIQRYENASGSGTPVVTTDRRDYPDGRVNKIYHYQGGEPVDSSLIRGYFTYYDSLGRMNYKSQTYYTGEVVALQRRIYEYDDHGRILSATDETGHVENFEYDNTGNPLVEGQPNVGAHNRLLFDANALYSYDPEGNLAQRWSLGTSLVDAVDAVLTTSNRAGSGVNVGWYEDRAYRAVLEGLEFSVGQVYSDPDYSTIELTLCVSDYDGGQTFDVEVDQIDVPLVAYSSGGQTVYRPDGDVLSMFSPPADYADREFVVTWWADGWDPDLEPGARFTVRQMYHLKEFTWDHRNRLTSVTEYAIEGFSETEGKDLPGPIGQKALVTEWDRVVYEYDVLDNLVSKEFTPTASGEDPTTEAYVVSLGHRVIDFRDAPDEEREIRRRLYAPGVDTLLAVDRRTENAAGDPTGTRVLWTLTDYQGSLGDLASIDDQGALQKQHVDYTAYGVPDYLNEPCELASYVDTFYAGRQYDEDTDLYHNRARWYDPAATRFLSEDPIGFAGGDANLYRYAANSPTNLTDPSGEFAVSGTILAIAGVSLLIGGSSAGALHYSASQYDAAADALGSARTAAEYARANDLYQSARMWHATGEVGGATALAIAGAPVANAGVGFYFGGMTAAFGTTGSVAAWTSTITLGGGLLASEVYDIDQNWGHMDSTERFRRVGMIAGPLIGGGWSGRLTSSWTGVGYRAGFRSVTWGRQAVGRGLSSFARASVAPSRARFAPAAENRVWVSGRGDIVVEGLPGPKGIRVPRRPTPAELRSLTEARGVEFSVVYRTGLGKAGGGGTYWLHSGSARTVRVPIGSDVRWIYHTHPKGTAFASSADQTVLKLLQQAGSPQRSSVVVPIGKCPVRFDIITKAR